MNYQKGIAPIVIAIIIAVLAAGGGGVSYYAVKQKQQVKSVEIEGEVKATTTGEGDADDVKASVGGEKEVVKKGKVEEKTTVISPAKTEPITKPVETIKIDPVSKPIEWSVYRSKNGAFELKYPKTYIVNDEGTCNEMDCGVTFRDGSRVDMHGNPDILISSTEASNPEISKEIYNIRNIIDMAKKVDLVSFNNNVKFSEREIMMGGASATLFSREILISGSFEQNTYWGSWKHQKTIFLLHKGFFWTIVIPGENPQFEEIVSSFKFLK